LERDGLANERAFVESTTKMQHLSKNNPLLNAAKANGEDKPLVRQNGLTKEKALELDETDVFGLTSGSIIKPGAFP